LSIAIGTTLERMAARWRGFYALNLHLPIQAMDHDWRARRRLRRGIVRRHAQPTRLPQIPWSEAFPRSAVSLVEISKRNGNVRLGELAILAQAAAATAPGTEIIEIGTFDGRTAINLSVNAPPANPVFTLDLPPGEATQFALDAGERHFVNKPFPGDRFRSCHPAWTGKAAKIVQMMGDSATFDWSAHVGKVGLVFVDGSHAYQYALADSHTAFRLAASGATVIWHDYGVWDGVTRALEEIESEQRLGLKHIRGTSLVVWRAGRPAGAEPPSR
jgi:hypothetical protein